MVSTSGLYYLRWCLVFLLDLFFSVCPLSVSFPGGGVVYPVSVSLGGEGFNPPLQFIRWHAECILTSIHCGYKICALLCPMVYGGVVLGEIVFQIMFSRHPIYHKYSLPDSVSDPLKRMLVDLKRLWRMLSLKNSSPVELSVTDGLGGWTWTISISSMRITVPL